MFGRLPLIAILLTALALAGPARAAEIPRPEGYVTDRAGILSVDTERKLERFLQSFEESDSTQIAVLTIDSLNGLPVEQYALQVAEEWGIGRKERDNGALLLISRDDREIRIEVGYGLEGRLTDLQAGRIVDLEIAPLFRQGNFDAGVLAGVSAMAEAVRGEYEGTGRTTSGRERNPLGLLALLFFLGPGLMFFGGRRRTRGHHRRGGIWIGAPMGGLGGRRGGGGGFGGFGGGGFGGGGASGGW